jgi:hypothetical protein
MIFEEQSTIEHMVLRILTHMQSLIQCQRVQVRARKGFCLSAGAINLGGNTRGLIIFDTTLAEGAHNSILPEPQH